MICSVCQTENDKYSTICRKCGAFLQARVPNLDLFDTLWFLAENPRKAFRLISQSEHKNYALFLYTLGGVFVCFVGIWHFRLGDRFETLLNLIFWALLAGIPAGIAMCPIASAVHWMLTKIGGGKSSFRNSLGTTSYALAPAIAALVLVLPIELLSFGMYFFSFNPDPMSLKPGLYITLLVLDGIVAAWSYVLMVVGTQIGCQMSLSRSFIVSTVFCILMVGGLIAGVRHLLPLV